MKETEFRSLKLPELSDPADITQLNENWETIDTEFDWINEEIIKHTNDKNNPHNVTAEQLGIDLTDFEEHIADKNNPHNVTASQVNAVSKNGDTMTGTLVIKDNPLKIEHGTVGNGGVGTEINGLNGSDNVNGHHFLDISHTGTEALMRLRLNVEENGALYDVKNLLQIRHQLLNGTGNWYNIFHSGNKPSGSYSGNNDNGGFPRTISIGGVGNILAVYSLTYTTIITPFGGFTMGNNETQQATYSSSEVTFNKGILTIKQSFGALNPHKRDGINAQSVSYRYQVL